MSLAKTKEWLINNKFLERDQEPIDIKDTEGKSIDSIFEFDKDIFLGEKIIAYLEDFTYTIQNNSEYPLLQGDSEGKRKKSLKLGYDYATKKGYKFFFLSCAYKESHYFKWAKDIILSFEPISTEVKTAKRFKPIFTDIHDKNFKEDENKLDLDIKRFEIDDDCSLVVMNTDKIDNIKKYLYIANPRAFKEENCVIRLPVLNEKEDDEKKDENYLPHNLIIYGAPGTGKSHVIDEKIMKEYNKYRGKITNVSDSEIINNKEKFSDSTNYNRVTFYEDYTYEAFVGCYKPRVEVVNDIIEEGGSEKVKYNIVSNKVTYKFTPGPFIDMLIKALNDKENNYYLVIEELNRANAPSVFGDMFQLLDRKGGESKYSVTPQQDLYNYLKSNLGEFDGTIKIPKNLYIWATMNSADQGVFPLDSAFKRRWNFYYMDIETPYDIKVVLPEGVYTWESIRKGINKRILSSNLIDEDRCIGSRFLSEEEFNQIEGYEISVENNNRTPFINNNSNPFIDKLIAYLRLDVFRNNPQYMFKKIEGMSSLSMSEIRRQYNKGKILDIFNIDENYEFVKISEEVVQNNDNVQ